MKPKSTPDPASLRERALAYLARREHSRFELTRKLEAAGFSVEEIAPVLDAFEARDWLSDRRFAESYIADHCARTGCVKLAHDLRQRGLDEDTIRSALQRTRESEPESALAVWKRKFGVLPASPAEEARQIRFMQSRGFALDLIRRLLKPAS